MLYDIISGQQLENDFTKIFQEANRKWNRELKEQQD